MAQLHLLVVVDSEDGSFHLAGMNEAPVDSDQAVFDDPEWRSPTEAEINTLIDAEAKLTRLFDDTPVGDLGLPFAEVGGVVQALGAAAVERGDVSHDQVVTYLKQDYDEDIAWTVLGPLVDEIEDGAKVPETSLATAFRARMAASPDQEARD